MAKDHAGSALPHYQEAVRLQPESGKAHLALGMALAATGDAGQAIPHLRKAAVDGDAEVREGAAQALRQLGK